MMRQIGQLYSEASGETYILAMLGTGIAGLICLEDGGLWGPPTEVDDFEAITPAEWNRMITIGTFTLIDPPPIVIKD